MKLPDLGRAGFEKEWRVLQFWYKKDTERKLAQLQKDTIFFLYQCLSFFNFLYSFYFFVHIFVLFVLVLFALSMIDRVINLSIFYNYQQKYRGSNQKSKLNKF